MSKAGVLLFSNRSIAVEAASVLGCPLLLLLASQEGRSQSWLVTRHSELYTQLWLSSSRCPPLNPWTVPFLCCLLHESMEEARQGFPPACKRFDAQTECCFPCCQEKCLPHARAGLAWGCCLSHSQPPVFSDNCSGGWEKSGGGGQAPGPLSLCPWSFLFCPLSAVPGCFLAAWAFYRDTRQALLCPHPAAGDQHLMKQDQTQPGGRVECLVPPQTGVRLGSQSPSSLWLPWITSSRCSASEQRGFSLLPENGVS